MSYFNQRMFSRLPVTSHRQRLTTGKVLLGDCVEVMATMPAGTVNVILTDPPYITNCPERSGRRVANDTNGDWLMLAFAQMHRLLKANNLCASLYGWLEGEVRVFDDQKEAHVLS